MNAPPAPVAATVDRTHAAAPAVTVPVFTIAGDPSVAGPTSVREIDDRPLPLAPHAVLPFPSIGVSTPARWTRPGTPTAIFCVHGARVDEVVACLPRRFVMHFPTAPMSMASQVARRQRLSLVLRAAASHFVRGRS